MAKRCFTTLLVKVNESKYTTLFLVSGCIKKLFLINFVKRFINVKLLNNTDMLEKASNI